MTAADILEQRTLRLRQLGVDVVAQDGACTVLKRHDGTILAHARDADLRVARERAIDQAERELRLDPIDATLADTFPASDPPTAGQPGIT
jgi:hypothetical protein